MPYFPAFESIYTKTDVECHKCERENCHSRGKYQRDRRDFTYTSGRCPRLPDMNGHVETFEAGIRCDAYPFIMAQIDRDDKLHLLISIPGDPTEHIVYRTKSDDWYYRRKGVKRVVYIDGHSTRKSVINYMNQRQAKYIKLPCCLSDYTL